MLLYVIFRPDTINTAIMLDNIILFHDGPLVLKIWVERGYYRNGCKSRFEIYTMLVWIFSCTVIYLFVYIYTGSISTAFSYIILYPLVNQYTFNSNSYTMARRDSPDICPRSRAGGPRAWAYIRRIPTGHFFFEGKTAQYKNTAFQQCPDKHTVIEHIHQLHTHIHTEL